MLEILPSTVTETDPFLSHALPEVVIVRGLSSIGLPTSWSCRLKGRNIPNGVLGTETSTLKPSVQPRSVLVFMQQAS